MPIKTCSCEAYKLMLEQKDKEICKLKMQLMQKTELSLELDSLLGMSKRRAERKYKEIEHWQRLHAEKVMDDAEQTKRAEKAEEEIQRLRKLCAERPDVFTRPAEFAEWAYKIDAAGKES